MNSNITLKEVMKVQLMLMILYIPSDFIVLIFFQGLNSWNEWKMEIIKMLMIMGLICFIVPICFYLKKSDKRKFSAYIIGIECIIFSVLILYSILNGYYMIYKEVSLETVYIYIAMLVVSFLFCKEICKKVPSEQDLNKKEKTEVNKGWIYCIVVITLLNIKNLSIGQKYIVNIMISLLICFGWMFLGWFMFQGSKVYIKDNNLETCKKDI